MSLPTLPTLPTLSGGGSLGNPAAIGLRAVRQPSQSQLPQQEEESILASLGRGALTGIGWLGETLDKHLGGRAIRGGLNMLAGGDTPYSELLSILPGSDTFGFTDARNAASGRDILDNAGITNQNVEGFHPIDNPMDALGDIAGFGVEVITDPSTYVGGPLKFLAGGTGALTKGGQMLKRAGMGGSQFAQDAATLAGKTATGVRRTGLEQTMGDAAGLLAKSDPATQARYVQGLKAAASTSDEAERAAAAAMLDRAGLPQVQGSLVESLPGYQANPYSDLPGMYAPSDYAQAAAPALLDEPTRGLFSYGIPFVGQGVESNVVGAGADLSGALGKYIVDPLDKLNSALRFGSVGNISPGRMLGSLVDTESAEGLSRQWQSDHGPRLRQRLDEAQANASARAQDVAREFPNGQNPADIERAVFEHVDPTFPLDQRALLGDLEIQRARELQQWKRQTKAWDKAEAERLAQAPPTTPVPAPEAPAAGLMDQIAAIQSGSPVQDILAHRVAGYVPPGSQAPVPPAAAAPPSTLSPEDLRNKILERQRGLDLLPPEPTIGETLGVSKPLAEAVPPAAIPEPPTGRKYKKSAARQAKEEAKRAAKEAVNADPKDVAELEAIAKQIEEVEKAGGSTKKLAQQYDKLFKKTYKIKRTASSAKAQANLDAVDSSQAAADVIKAAKEEAAKQDELIDTAQPVEPAKPLLPTYSPNDPLFTAGSMSAKRGGSMADKLNALRSKKAQPLLEPAEAVPEITAPVKASTPPPPPAKELMSDPTFNPDIDSPGGPTFQPRPVKPSESPKLRELREAKAKAHEPFKAYDKSLGLKDRYSDKALDAMKKAGVNVDKHDEEEAEYTMRGLIGANKNLQGPRLDELRKIQGGTRTIMQALRDDELGRIVDEARDFPAARQHLVKTYGDALGSLELTRKVRNIANALKKETDQARKAKITKSLKEAREALDKDIYSKAMEIVNMRQALTPEQIKAGGFGRHITQDFQAGDLSSAKAVAWADTIRDVVAKEAKNYGKFPKSKHKYSVRDLINEFNLSEKEFLANVAKTGEHQIPKDGQALTDWLNDTRIPDEIAGDMRRWKQRSLDFDEQAKPLKVIDSLTNLFKSFALARPARLVRDAASSASLAIFTGNGTLAGMFDAAKFTWTKHVPDKWKNLPAVKEWLQAHDMPATSENVRKAIADALSRTNTVGPHQSVNIGQTIGAMHADESAPLLDSVMGRNPLDPTEPLKTLKPTKENAKLLMQPWKSRGVMKLDGTIRQATDHPIAKASEQASGQVEFFNRLVPFVHNLEKGASFEEAAAIAKALNVDYSSRNFTRFEKQVVSRLIPFFKYSRKIIPTIIDQVLSKPGGGVAQLIRGYKNSATEGFMPEHLQGQLAIPVGQNDDGTQRYLTSLGLPIETLNTFHFGQGGLKKTGLDLLGMTNPLIKGPLEQMTGRQFYSDRDLRDLNPRSGQILKNLGLTDNEKIIPQPVDQLLSNSPASSLLSMVGTATDPRKGIGAKALNLASGLRLSDVDLAKQKEYATRNLVDELLRGAPGVRAYTDLYVKPEDVDKLSEQQKKVLALRRSLSAKASSARGGKKSRVRKPKKPKLLKAKKRSRRRRKERQ